MDRHADVQEVIEDVNKVLKELPEVTQGSHKEFFETHNLWRRQIQTSCLQLQEYYEGVRALAERQLLRPAAALSGSIHEASIHLEYLNHQEDLLVDWWKWQITRNYFFFDDQLRYDELSPLNRVLRNRDKNECAKLLGVPPQQRVRPQWRSTKELIEAAAQGMPDGYEERWRRLLFAYPSNFVHISHAEDPTWTFMMGSSQSSVLVTMQVAMEICRDRRLGPDQSIKEINDIVAHCVGLRRICDHDSEP